MENKETQRILNPVNHCENIYWFTSSDPATYHAQAYLLLHPQGSILIDLPNYCPEVIRAIQEICSPSYIFITHKDDIGAAPEFQSFFNARVVLHTSEVRHYPEGLVDIPFEGDFLLHPDIMIVHLPGHTAGSSALVDMRPPGAVFVGDALNIREDGELYIPPHPWDFDPILKRYTLKKLLEYTFAFLLPAHPPSPGQVVSKDARLKLESLLKRVL